MSTTYILQKDLPDVFAGERFIKNETGSAYYLPSKYTRTGYNHYNYPVEFIERNPEWFKKEEPENTVFNLGAITVQLATIEKIEKAFNAARELDKYDAYKFKTYTDYAIHLWEGECRKTPIQFYNSQNKYTKEDMIGCWMEAMRAFRNSVPLGEPSVYFEDYIKSLKP